MAARLIARPPAQTSDLASASAGLQRNDAGALTLHGVDLAALGQRERTPLHVVDGERLRQRVRTLTQGTPAWPAGCELATSYKTNPVPGVLSLMQSAGAGAEVVTEAELWLAQRLGVEPDRLIFNGSVKSDAALRAALSMHIACININSIGELDRITRLAEQLGVQAQIGVRAALPGNWSGQFGIAPGSDAWQRAWMQIIEHPCLQPTGLHVHKGLTLRTAAAVHEHVDQCLETWATLHADFDLELGILNLGGSLCVPEVHGISSLQSRLNQTLLAPIAPQPPGLSAEAYVEVVHDRLAKSKVAPKPKRVIIETGRGATGDTQHLLLSVVDLKPDPDGYTYAILDGGTDVAHTLRSESHRIVTAGPARPQRQPYRLVGPVCSPADVLRSAVWLPSLAVGDVLAVLDTGAYFTSFSLEFTTPAPGIRLIDAHQNRWLRRPQQFEDMFACDDLPVRPHPPAS